MGVKGLWRVLQPIKEEVLVSSLRGKVLAVDLAIWVVQSETVTHNELQKIYLRQMFYKINHLLEHGVGIIIVTDGRAPHLKALTIARRLGVELDRNSKVIQRRRFMRIMKECETLAQSLGITVLKGAFEAEAAAARLQQDGLVDGVITTDGDAFLYGARQVYRNLLVTEKECEVYKMSRVESEVGLSRDDLVGMAILNGCDFNPDGVSGLGRGTVLNYILSRDRSRTVTEELVGWSEQAAQIGHKYKQLEGIKRKPHCSICKHQGSKKEHSISGCTCCNTVSGCAPNGTPCSCTKHVAQRLLSSPHMQCCVKFVNQNNVAVIPVKEIVVEFGNNRPNESVSPSWQLPPCAPFVNFMEDKLQWRKQVSAEKFAHIAVLHHISQHIVFSKPYPVEEHTTLQFNHILKRRRKDKVDLFELEYSVLDPRLKSWLEFDVVYAKLDAELVQYLLPAAVQEFSDREKRFTRKKKENIPIYERYQAKKTSPNETKNKAYTRPKTAGKKTRSVKKMDNLSDSLSALNIADPFPLRDITDSLSSSTISSTPSHKHDKETVKLANEKRDKRGDKKAAEANNLSSSEDEYIPLGQRIALRRAKSAKSKSGPDTAVGSTSSLSSLESKQASETSKSSGKPGDINYVPDQIETETETENMLDESERVDTTAHNEDTTLSGSEADGYIDSDVQLLPHNFMDEYLDLSRDEILGISREEAHSLEEGSEDHVNEVDMKQDDLIRLTDVLVVDEGTASEVLQNGENGLLPDQDDRSISRDNSFLATESVDSEDYRQLVEGADYHKLFFATPIMRDRAFPEVMGDENPPTISALEIPTVKLSQVTSQSDIEAGDDSNEASSKHLDYSPSDVVNISSDSSVDSAAEDDIKQMKTRSESSYENQQTCHVSILKQVEDVTSDCASTANIETSGADSKETSVVITETNGITTETFGVTTETSAVTTKSDEVTAESAEVTAESGEVTAESGKETTETGEVTTETDEVTTEIGKVNTENGEVTKEFGEVTTESGEVATETGEVTTETGEVTTDTGKVTTEIGEVTKESGKVSAVASEVTTEKSTVTTEASGMTTGIDKATIIRNGFSPGTSDEISKNVIHFKEIEGSKNMTIAKFEDQKSLNFTAELENELRDVSDVSGGFSPKTPRTSGGFSPKTPAPENTVIPDISNLSLNEFLSFSPDQNHVTISPTKHTPLPDISTSRLVDSVITESVKEMLEDSVTSNVESVDEISREETSPDGIISASEILSTEISIKERLSANFSPLHPDPVVLVPDTPAVPELQGLSRDVSRDVTQELSLTAAGSTVLGPITPHKPTPALPQKLTFDPQDITELDLSPSYTAELHNDPLIVPSDSSSKREVLSPSVLSSPDPIIPGILSQPHLPPDTSFLEPEIQIGTPAWRRAPLSDIRGSSTPRVLAEGVLSDQVIDVNRTVESAPLPDILTERSRIGQPDFNLNITELLERSDYT